MEYRYERILGCYKETSMRNIDYICEQFILKVAQVHFFIYIVHFTLN